MPNTPTKDKLTLGQVLHVKVPHAVKALLDVKGSYWFSNSRMAKYQTMMCENPQVHLDLIATLNPVTLLPNCEEDPDYEYLQVMEEVFSSRPDLKDVPLDKYDLQLFTDGSSYMDDGKKVSGYAVVSAEEIIEANLLPGHTSAQLAEIAALLEAVWKPSAVSIMYCRGHQKGHDEIPKGNRRADQAAKAAAKPLLTTDPAKVLLCKQEDQPAMPNYEFYTNWRKFEFGGEFIEIILHKWQDKYVLLELIYDYIQCFFFFISGPKAEISTPLL
uniref:Opioid growth factor receptor (OGFr) conserved domain-containing protein n=1 Tax=Leptobrachium leishanense TaxID=445787 RepID=A0A8C5QQK3_9ANUR